VLLTRAGRRNEEERDEHEQEETLHDAAICRR
jgi:hypothetical protein